mmetsp:Transcript_6570/g.12324  ORF Transcript_6570/g.12324 Transcript_6570/m.12324 type:complete len:518 (-) Transcript_6570:1875-3428(-)
MAQDWGRFRGGGGDSLHRRPKPFVRPNGLHALHPRLRLHVRGPVGLGCRSRRLHCPYGPRHVGGIPGQQPLYDRHDRGSGQLQRLLEPQGHSLADGGHSTGERGVNMGNPSRCTRIRLRLCPTDARLRVLHGGLLRPGLAGHHLRRHEPLPRHRPQTAVRHIRVRHRQSIGAAGGAHRVLRHRGAGRGGSGGPSLHPRRHRIHHEPHCGPRQPQFHAAVHWLRPQDWRPDCARPRHGEQPLRFASDLAQCVPADGGGGGRAVDGVHGAGVQPARRGVRGVLQLERQGLGHGGHQHHGLRRVQPFHCHARPAHGAAADGAAAARQRLRRRGPLRLRVVEVRDVRPGDAVPGDECHVYGGERPGRERDWAHIGGGCVAAVLQVRDERLDEFREQPDGDGRAVLRHQQHEARVPHAVPPGRLLLPALWDRPVRGRPLRLLSARQQVPGRGVGGPAGHRAPHAGGRGPPGHPLPAPPAGRAVHRVLQVARVRVRADRGAPDGAGPPDVPHQPQSTGLRGGV